jgi:GNAT superfamily N-acetyltransferase
MFAEQKDENEKKIAAHVFFRAGTVEEAPVQADGLEWSLWRVRLFSIWPRGLEDGRQWWLVRWLLYISGVLSGRQYCALIAKDGTRIVHYSVICSRWFRFPGCLRGDLIIGPTRTDPEYRRRGIALRALLEIRYRFRQPGRQFLYVAEEHNIPSQIVALRAGFHLFAVGRRMPRFGLRSLGQFFETGGPEEYRLPEVKGMAQQSQHRDGEQARSTLQGPREIGPLATCEAAASDSSPRDQAS